MLFSVLLSLTNPAEACIAPISVDATFPMSDVVHLPTNTTFQVRLSCQELWEDPQFIVEHNGVVVDAEIRFHRRMITAEAESVFVEIDPVEDFKPGAEVSVSMDYFGMRSPVGDYVIGELAASDVVEDVPSIGWMWTEDVSWEEPDGECFIEKEGMITFEFYEGLTYGQAIRFYEVDPSLRDQEITPEQLTTPFHTVLDSYNWDEMSALIPEEKLNGEDMCFTATFMNASGVESLPSEIRCVSDMQRGEALFCGLQPTYGCSTMQTTDLGWMAMLMGTLGFARRRKR